MNFQQMTLLALLGATGTAAQADWKVQFTGEAARMFGSAPRGSFSTRGQCEAARQGLTPFEIRRSSCVGFDAPRGGGNVYRPRASGGGSRGFAASIMGGLMQSFMQGFQQGLQAPTRDPAAERRAAEERRRREFQAWQARVKADLARQETQYRDLRRQEVVQEARMLGDLLAQRLDSQKPRVNPQADRLLQSACWSRQAAMAAAQGDAAGAEAARTNAARALEGTAPPCADEGLPAVPMPGTPSPAGGLEMGLGALVQEETARVEVQIQDLVIRRAKTQETFVQRRETVQVREQAKAAAQDPGAQAEADRLLAEARQALEEALAENLKASEELNAAQDTLQALKAVGTLAPGPTPKAEAE